MLPRWRSIVAGMLLAALVVAPASARAGGGGTGQGGGGGGDGGGSRVPFDRAGMWIWYVDQAENGRYGAIARKARRHGIRTLYIKSSDGSNAWSQFTDELISFMHNHGLRVCAWQYVYGNHPLKEASRGAEAVKTGADCLVIDAESEYEGRYAPAVRYVRRLQDLIGHRVPVALTGFPYVDYHPAFPYSVFLGLKGARFNLPQLYWHTIGTTVADGYLHTFTYNRVYRRPIYPLGQTYGHPPRREVQLFRKYAHSYGFAGVSWWVWHDTTKRIWRALGRRVGDIDGFTRPTDAYPILSKGSESDLVVLAQERLRGAGRHVPVTGYFGRRTKLTVMRFQADHGLPETGVIGPRTWRQLLHYRAVWINWAAGTSKTSRGASPGAATGPRSALLPALHDEIPTGLHSR